MASGYEGGKKITVLSIDGGGVRAGASFQALFWPFLNPSFRELDGPKARIADYFDVVAGTSTGGLITIMLTTPNKEGTPMFAAHDINNFYFEHVPKIFPQTCFAGELKGPKYDGKYLRSVINQQLGDKTLKETLTNVVIPAFDIKLLQTVIFSTNDAKENALKNARLADVCISTSAAPTFLPAHYFETKDAATGEIRTFDLIDGGVAATNPTLMATSHVTKELSKHKNKPIDSKQMLVLSLGTGEAKKEQKYNAATASEWGLLNSVYDSGKMPLLDIYTDASFGIVDFHVSTFFQCLGCLGDYLRIQEDSLTGDAASMDILTEENMQKLVEIGTNLLKEPVSRVDLETGRFQKIEGEGTNEEALAEFAKLPSEERKLRRKVN